MLVRVWSFAFGPTARCTGDVHTEDQLLRATRRELSAMAGRSL